LKAEEKFSNR